MGQHDDVGTPVWGGEDREAPAPLHVEPRRESATWSNRCVATEMNLFCSRGTACGWCGAMEIR